MESCIRQVLPAIADLNGQLLAALADCARSHADRFPLPNTVRADFGRLTRSECHKRGQCGILLADMRFTDQLQWERLATQDDPTLERARPHWLATPEGLLIAHSVLMISWYVVQTVPSLAGVILGMSREVAQIVRNLAVSRLADAARTRSGWIIPRWAERVDLWSHIIGCGQNELCPKPVPILRLLQASATQSARLLNTMQVGNTLESDVHLPK